MNAHILIVLDLIFLAEEIYQKKIKISNEIQGPHFIFFALVVIGGNYEPTCIVTIQY